MFGTAAAVKNRHAPAIRQRWLALSAGAKAALRIGKKPSFVGGVCNMGAVIWLKISLFPADRFEGSETVYTATSNHSHALTESVSKR